MEMETLRAILDAIRDVRIGVIGDFCLDAYWILDPSLSEISVETGLATRAVRAQRYSLGGAGNVVSNLLAMGVARVSAFGVLGTDPFAQEMMRILKASGVNAAGMLVQESDWATPVYVKPVAEDVEQARIDFGNANTLSSSTGRALLERLSAALPDLDLVIINQQLLHGIHTEELRRDLSRLTVTGTSRFICDSRSWSDAFTGAIRKLNDREALRLCGKEWDFDLPVPRPDAEAAAETLFHRWKTPVFLTRGSYGMLVRDEAGTREVPGLYIVGRTDTVGAGDSALAGIAAALAAGRDALEAATVGNYVAGVTIQKLFITGTASAQEIMAIGTDPEYVHCPELAEDPRMARFQGTSEIEVVSAPLRPVVVTHAIFDNDGTISTLREGWEAIMEPVMIEAVLGESWKSAEEQLYRTVRERVRRYIDATTGVQTLVQMTGLVEMVKEFGILPAAQVKDAAGYKALYNKGLLAMVDGRLAKLRRGELAIDDFMVKGALPFLKALHAGGVKLYLASGTDEEDLITEAKSLGHADLFEGRIHGAVGDIAIEAKKVVLERILGEIDRDGAGTLVTFGDGPVEMRETRKRGGIAVGIASDEPRRFGWNMKKRSRVIRAGAHYVVPDFSQGGTLLALLGIRS